MLASLTSESGFFFFFSLFEKVGLSRDWKRNILLGWPNKETKDLKKKKKLQNVYPFLGGCYK